MCDFPYDGCDGKPLFVLLYTNCDFILFRVPVIPNFNGFDTTANVGMSSFLNEDRQLLLAEARLVTAHELGGSHSHYRSPPCH